MPDIGGDFGGESGRQQEEMMRREQESRRREKYDQLHANYDDPPRPLRRRWQFWKRGDSEAESSY